jgi:O-methyltransferase involved in polyketide biosynthesis
MLPFAVTDRKPLGLRSVTANKGGHVLDQLTPVQQVSLLALRLRALDARSPAPILGDRVSLDVARAVGLDLSTPRIPRSAVLVHAVRARMIDAIVGEFVAAHPRGVVIDLGCGLDSRRQRCAVPATVDWYDVDLPPVARLRERVVPGGTHVIAADVTASGWWEELPADRPVLAVSDGLLALLSQSGFTAVARSLTSRFAVGEFAFNAYSRLALRNARRMSGRGPLSMPVAGEGIDDPHEAEGWGVRLRLVEERFMGRAPEIGQFPPVLRAVSRINARSTRLARAADRVLRYRFEPEDSDQERRGS